MTAIQARIKIKTVQGADLGYEYEKEFLDSLDLEPSEFEPNETFVNIGTTFIYHDHRYEIVGVNSKFVSEEIIEIDEIRKFNFQITYLVQRL